MLRFRQRLARDEGFTLIELLVVLIILGFQKKAQQTAAMSDVRSAIPDAEAYYSDNNSYTGMNASGLQTTYDSGLVISNGTTTGISKAEAATGNPQGYCISAVSGGHWAHVNRPGGQVTNDTAATSDPCP